MRSGRSVSAMSAPAFRVIDHPVKRANARLACNRAGEPTIPGSTWRNSWRRSPAWGAADQLRSRAPRPGPSQRAGVGFGPIHRADLVEEVPEGFGPRPASDPDSDPDSVVVVQSPPLLAPPPSLFAVHPFRTLAPS